MSRYAPPARDRSPPRYDRRPSTYSLGGSSYRGTGEPQTPIDRDPPRGPRAENFRGGYPFSPAGRGRGTAPFPARPGDTWRDRERDRERDARPPPSYRSREDDRPDWPRRERDLGPPDNRVTGPPRDTRPYPPRDRSASPPRARRDSRESLPPLTTRLSDTGPAFRGGLNRGRGRGDWDRGRGRTSFVGDRDRERDLFSGPRSPSRDSNWRERDFERARPIGSDGDRGDRYAGRDRSRERRDHDIWSRDLSPGRVGNGPGTRTASPANSTGHHGPTERTSKMDYELTRRSSVTITPSSASRDIRRDADSGEYFPRTEPRREVSYSSLSQAPVAQPSATAGLDYGPPPSAPVITPAEKPPPSRSQPPKTVSPAMPATQFQPPSAPKADRAPPVPPTAPSQKPVAPAEPLKTDLQPSRPQGPTTSNTATELFPKKMEAKKAESKPEQKPMPPAAPDRAMPANVPLGPRSSFGSSFRTRPSPPMASPQFTPPKLPFVEARGSVIPTGPRLDRDREPREGPWQATQPNISSRSWISPEFNRAKPSIMSPINKDRPPFAPTGPRSQSILPPHSDKRPHPPSIMNSAVGSTHSVRQPPAEEFSGGRGLQEEGPATEDVDMSLPVSSDEDAEEDDFDEDDYAASEAKFERERKALEARKPPPLLQDAVIRSALIRLQLLNMIADGVMMESMDDKVPATELSSRTNQAQTGLPSPDEAADLDTQAEVKHPQPRGRPMRQTPVNPIPTPPIEDLPYLQQLKYEPIVFEESDDDMQHDAVALQLRDEFSQAAMDWDVEMTDLKADFYTRYSTWKDSVAILNRVHRDIQLTPVPASPAPSVPPSVTPSIGHERTRGGRNTTEADLQAAIALSQQTMKEEEERREREAASSSVPNFEHEAEVPAMLTPKEIALIKFDDSNKLIPPELALEVFAYVPPEDDFTNEEQLAFIQAFCQTPKKWGKIAEALPDRSYQDCITHYYLTKGEAKYKEIWRRSQPKRKRGRASTKPRSTALMSELVYRDGEDGAVAVTDTGRPRRAAAPTFGDAPGEPDPQTVAPPAKRVAGSKESTGDAGPAKPARGRKTGATTKTRRTKAQILADQQAAQAAQAASLAANSAMDGSPLKVASSKDRNRPLIRADEHPPPHPDVPAGFGALKGTLADMPSYNVLDDRLAQSATPHGLNQPTSYWSVPEQQKFPQLIAYYGRDFASIADFMKTKTSTMIKNFYNRQILEGKTELSDLAEKAEIRRSNGEAMGPPPSPAVQTKRRYEATPSTAISQTGRPISEQHPPEAESATMPLKQGYTEDFPSNAVQRNFTGDLVAKARPAMQDPLSALQQPKAEELHRSLPLSHKPGVGPRMGFFKEENTSFNMPRQALSQDNSPHQHPLRPGEHRLGEMGNQIPAGSPRQINLGPPREIPPYTSHAPGLSSIPGVLLHNDRYGGHQLQHARNGSMGGLPHTSTEQHKPVAAPRHLESLSTRPYSMVPPRTSTPPHVTGIPPRRPESAAGGSSASTSDAPQPAAKRSNIMNLLNNDDAPESRPAKRTSLDSQHRNTMISPQTRPQQSSPFDPSRNPLRLDGSPAEIDRMRTPLGLAPHPLREQQSGFSAGQPSAAWIDRYDPRQTGSLSDSRSLHPSPRAAQYSVVPPAGGSSLRMETPRPGEGVPQDHRRSYLSQLSHPGPVPSPPPQPPVQSYRSLSGSGHHGHNRMGSLGFPHSQSSQEQPPQSQQPGSGPPSHPHSANSTPVPSLHHGRPSMDYPQHHRQTIQQHMATLHHTTHREPQSLREREQEQAFQRQREIEAQQQQQHPQHRGNDRERDPYAYRREGMNYGPAPPREGEGQQPQGPHHHHHQLSQPRPLGFPSDPLQRSYTPQPHPSGPSQYAQSHTPGQPPSSGSQYHPHQHMQKQSHSQGPAPPAGVHATNHPAFGHGHYRRMSQEERR